MFTVDKQLLVIQTELTETHVDKTGERQLWREQVENQLVSQQGESNREMTASNVFSDNEDLFILSREESDKGE